MEIDPLWVLGGWITFSSSSSRYSSTCMAKPSSPSLSPATSHQKTLPIYHQLTKTSSTTTTTLKPSIFFISSLFFLLILTVARPSPHDQVVAVVAVQAATEVKLPESSVRTLGTKTFTTVAAGGRTLKSSESSAPGTGTAARDDSKATAVETTGFGPGKGHKHGPKTSSENEFKAAAHEVPSGPNPISN